MSHNPITINNLALAINDKICFENFSTHIYSGKHILIMGNNGTGKSTLLKMILESKIQNIISPTQGNVNVPIGTVFGYVPQTITDYEKLSGGQRFNQELSYALSLHPDVLLLDEPTNHLDLKNRHSLIRMLQRWQKTLLIVSHDPEILNLKFDEIWHIEHGKILIFKGDYAAYCVEHAQKQQTITHQREQLQKEKRQLKKMVELEHKRAGNSKSAHKHENDRVLLGSLKERGSQTAGKNLKKLSKTQEAISNQLGDTFVHKKIEPKFNLNARTISSGKSIVSIMNGSCGYLNPVLTNIHIQLTGNDRLAIIGDNGSGKSTFIKALLKDPEITIDGTWQMPEDNAIGYLDQHYSNLNPDLTAQETIQEVVPDWDNLAVRKHLNDFLFSSQKEVMNKVSHLSGGEKARLSLAQIAAQNPALLLLDEITNNIDLQTREHVIEVLSQYPGAMIIVSHDPQFLQALSVSTYYKAENGKLELVVT